MWFSSGSAISTMISSSSDDEFVNSVCLRGILEWYRDSDSPPLSYDLPRITAGFNEEAGCGAGSSKASPKSSITNGWIGIFCGIACSGAVGSIFLFFDGGMKFGSFVGSIAD